MTEGEIKADIRLALGRLPDVRLWNNPVGEAWQGKVVEHSDGFLLLQGPRRVTYGLCPSSSDLIGPRRIVVTPVMVGRTIAVFSAIECKAPGGRFRPRQRDFLDFVRDFGGFAGVARGPEDALRVLEYES